jgi:hypothetical protein
VESNKSSTSEKSKTKSDSVNSNIRTKRIILFTALLGIVAWQIVNNAVIRPLTTVNDQPLPYLDGFMWYSPSQAYETIASYTPEAIEGYFYFQITDLILPILYSSLLFVAISLGFRNRWGIVVIIGAFFDYLENLSLHLMFRNYPETDYVLASAANIFGSFKFLFLLISAGLAIIASLKYLSNQRGINIRNAKTFTKK